LFFFFFFIINLKVMIKLNIKICIYLIKKKQEIEIEDLSFCIICGNSEHEEIMLLCDMCDAPYHTS